MATPSSQGSPAPAVGIIMGSKSDWKTLERAAATLRELDVPHECEIVSAHRTPEKLTEYARTAAERGLKVIIAGAGAANAALLAVSILSLNDKDLNDRLCSYRQSQTDRVLADELPPVV